MQALPVRGALTLRPGGDIWHKPALSVVITLAIPEVALLLAGRLDLAFYVAAGAAFLPQRLADVPAHLVLGLLGGA
ncbi:MAG: hypothetical protein QOF44_1537, partial [Streptomyces sp.]|nr:hypothetical protein [Streptomyces sp.]